MSEVYILPNLGAVRGLDIGGDPWFSASDICKHLGIANPSKVISGLNRSYASIGFDSIHSKYAKLESATGPKESLVIPEAMVYELAFKSRKPKAVKFSVWVSSELLPSLQSLGSYQLHKS